MAKKRKTAPDAPAGSLIGLPKGYDVFLRDIKERIRTAQLRATVAVNRELIELYWHTGQQIVERQQRQGWGGGVIERLAKDLQAAFPGVQGFSRSNIWRMRAFYLAYTEQVTILAQVVRELDGQTLPEACRSLPWVTTSFSSRK
jgi:hypothetical protein